jgi:hypothetical protein
VTDHRGDDCTRVVAGLKKLAAIYGPGFVDLEDQPASPPEVVSVAPTGHPCLSAGTCTAQSENYPLDASAFEQLIPAKPVDGVFSLSGEEVQVSTFKAWGRWLAERPDGLVWVDGGTTARKWTWNRTTFRGNGDMYRAWREQTSPGASRPNSDLIDLCYDEEDDEFFEGKKGNFVMVTPTTVERRLVRGLTRHDCDDSFDQWLEDREKREALARIEGAATRMCDRAAEKPATIFYTEKDRWQLDYYWSVVEFDDGEFVFCGDRRPGPPSQTWLHSLKRKRPDVMRAYQSDRAALLAGFETEVSVLPQGLGACTLADPDGRL